MAEKLSRNAVATLKYGPALTLIIGMHQLAASVTNVIHAQSLLSVGNLFVFMRAKPPNGGTHWRRASDAGYKNTNGPRRPVQ